MNLAALQSFRIPAVRHAYARKDAILYALGLGYGEDPLDPAQLRYVYEDGLAVVPSFCAVLAHPGFWVKDPILEIDWRRLLHVEQRLEIHRALAPEGCVEGRYRIAGVEDRGPDRGAVVRLEKQLVDPADDTSLATVTSLYLLRGDGGQGGFGEMSPTLGTLPERGADRVAELPTLPQMALLYRLSGDWNPIHADPQIARQAGFDRPILQGLCTLGIATRALVATYAARAPERLAALCVRFTRPAYPGDTIRTEFFEDGDEIRFRSIAVERNEIVLDRGSATLRT